VLGLPRQKALLAMLLECAASLLTKDGSLWLAGENKAGIKSADKLLKNCFAQTRKLDNARHCTLYEATLPRQQRPFISSSFREEWPIPGLHRDIKAISYPGVFAHGRLDKGTAVLLEVLSGMDISGDILDFGCGAGVIGASIAASNPNTNITFLDINALALFACNETLLANGLSGSVLASDGLAEVQGSFDLVITNPPIHAGVKTDNRLSIRLMAEIHQHIKPGGQLFMVANRHLPYENWLLQDFHNIIELFSNDHFKVISAHR
jgi:16S rRNA (guanine1207-N2)-methyltransferase